MPLWLFLSACTTTWYNPAPVPGVELVDFTQVVPSQGLPAEVVPDVSNNNLDVTWHDDRLFLAFRTGPSHFASTETEMHVVSSLDEQDWRHEGSFAMGTDVREPQLVSWQGELHLYMAVLGDNPLDFEPQGMVHHRYLGEGSWTEASWFDDPTFIPWRIKAVDGRLQMMGYSGGDAVYDPVDGEPIQIRWLASDDATTWEPTIAGQEVVLEGGGSETDYVFLADGDLLAVVRNEAGDEHGFGSKICRAPAADLGAWDCIGDPRKYDSPLLFTMRDRVWLVARRNVTETGHYDLGLEDLDHSQQYLAYQADYWVNPKRCALWWVDPASRTVHHWMDLPSRGDTCFPEAVDYGDGEVLLYNYSSDPEGPDVSWVEGQTAPTFIHRMILRNL